MILLSAFSIPLYTKYGQSCHIGKSRLHLRSKITQNTPSRAEVTVPGGCLHICTPHSLVCSATYEDGKAERDLAVPGSVVLPGSMALPGSVAVPGSVVLPGEPPYFTLTIVTGCCWTSSRGWDWNLTLLKSMSIRSMQRMLLFHAVL